MNLSTFTMVWNLFLFLQLHEISKYFLLLTSYNAIVKLVRGPRILMCNLCSRSPHHTEQVYMTSPYPCQSLHYSLSSSHARPTEGPDRTPEADLSIGRGRVTALPNLAAKKPQILLLLSSSDVLRSSESVPRRKKAGQKKAYGRMGLDCWTSQRRSWGVTWA